MGRTRKQNKTALSTENATQRKSRFSFTIGRDISFLKKLIAENPWEYGSSKWGDVSNHFMSIGWNVTERTLKNRLSHLQEQLKTQTQYKTGTEEEKTERASLLEEIEALVDAAQARDRMIITTNPDDDSLDNSNTVNADDFPLQNNDEFESQMSAETVTVQDSKKQKLKERQQAEKERDSALKKYSDTPPEPNSIRKKRTRLCEEDLIMKRQEHEMEIETRKLELEEKRELRIQAESERKDEIRRLEIDFQKQQLVQQQKQMEQQQLLFSILAKVAEK